MDFRIPREVFAADLPLPNVYLATVEAVGQPTRHLYIAADFTGAAIAKLRQHCREEWGFAPYSSNSNIKLRRLKLGHYLQSPQALQEAGELAAKRHERDTVEALHQRRREVEALCQQLVEAREGGVDFDAVEAALARELRAASA